MFFKREIAMVSVINPDQLKLINIFDVYEMIRVISRMITNIK